MYIDDLDNIPHPGRKLTEREFFEWCRGFECLRAEWVDGETITMPFVTPKHSQMRLFLGTLLSMFVEREDLGEIHGPSFACFLAQGRRVIRVPDILFVAKANVDRFDPDFLNGAPDLAVEIVSRESISRDYRDKYLDYESAGVREYWNINPFAQNIEMSSLDENTGEFRPIPLIEDRLSSVVLPGFFLRPEWLWSDPMPAEDDVLRQMVIA